LVLVVFNIISLKIIHFAGNMNNLFLFSFEKKKKKMVMKNKRYEMKMGKMLREIDN